jgi:tetratricopeptide (TPR) repeat protein
MRDRRARASLAEYTEGAKYREPKAFDLKLVSLDYVLLGDYLDAGKWLSESLTRDSSDAQGWYYLGRIRYKQSKYTEAIQAFHQALALDPKNAKTEDNLGLVYERLGQRDDAIAAYRTAIAWSQTHSAGSDGPWFDLGSLLQDLHRSEEALPILRQALVVNPNDARTHGTLAKTYQSLDKWQAAQAELEKAVQLSPHAAHLHYLLGRAYQKNGFTEKARSEFATASALNAHGTSLQDDAMDP